MEQVNGSARVRLGNSDILVGVKLEIDTPFPDRPYEGKLEFFVDWYLSLKTLNYNSNVFSLLSHFH